MKLLFTIILAAVWLFALTCCGKAADASAPSPVPSTEIMDAEEIQRVPSPPADETMPE